MKKILKVFKWRIWRILGRGLKNETIRALIFDVIGANSVLRDKIALLIRLIKKPNRKDALSVLNYVLHLCGKNIWIDLQGNKVTIKFDWK